MILSDYAKILFKANKIKVVEELKFHPTRKWRFDFAIPDKMIAIEIEGAIFANGRHTRGGGFLKDIDKYNSATMLGWKVLRAGNKEQLNKIMEYIIQI